MPYDLNNLTAVDAARLLRDGAITSVALVDAAIARAEQSAAWNAFITLDAAGARAAARQADADRAAGRAGGALHGVPIVIKDNIHVAGLPSTAGTPALKGFVPTQHAPVAQALIDAGAIVVGKTNMHELAFGVTGYNEGFHVPGMVGVRNPLDPSRIPGGSSSGTATAIASGVVAAGLGSDTGASVRLPSAYTNGVALRPTVHRYSQAGICPLSHTRDTAGPMARTVADVALLHSVIGGAPVPAPAVLKDVRLGICRNPFFANLDADTLAVMAAAFMRLQAAGVTLVELDMPALSALDAEVSFPVVIVEAHDDLVDYLRTWNTGVTIEQVVAQIASADVKAIYESMVLPKTLPGPTGPIDARPAYAHAMQTARPALRKLYADTFAQHRIDALAFPTSPIVPPRQGPEACTPEMMGRMIQNT
ncbi:MAG: amidase family protein, partial [Burkholderiales bacterium]|nr:amidase family protein [Burkholderiales bacterium]